MRPHGEREHESTRVLGYEFEPESGRTPVAAVDETHGGAVDVIGAFALREGGHAERVHTPEKVREGERR